MLSFYSWMEVSDAIIVEYVLRNGRKGEEKEMKCDNCHIDLTGTTLFNKYGNAGIILCLVCSAIDTCNKIKSKKREMK